jgi:3-oxoacyl-[acyl-carrier-protein] synthase II
LSTEHAEVWVTGIGLVSSLGEGLDAHWEQLAPGKTPSLSLDTESQAPFPVHPLVDFDISTQIPKRSDQRQMGQWQHLGTYAAGLALDDAGIAHDPDLLAQTNMIVAAGGGERDLEVDSQIMETLAAGEVEDPGTYLNNTLMTELRPTLFLAQLSNLMAGNISIVHGVTDSSRTFMGEEMAGVSAVETAVGQIRHGQGELFLVGGAYIAERADMTMLWEFGHTLWPGEQCPVWERKDSDGGMVMGSAGAFLILESKEHAEARGARPYARIDSVVAGRCKRQDGAAKQSAQGLLEQIAERIPEGPMPVLTGCCGVQPQLREELEFLNGLADRGIQPAVRGVTSILGNTLEAQFPINVILASLAISRGAFFDPFDDSGVEQSFSGEPQQVLISNWGHWRGESLALVGKPDTPLRGQD